MQRHTPVHMKQGRLATQSSAANRSARRKVPPPSVNKKSKPKPEPFNFDRFVHKLKLESLRTERFASPTRTLQEVLERERRNNSSKSRSRQATKSIETSRDKSGQTYRRTMKQKEPRAKSRSMHPKIGECLKQLHIPRGLQFRELATEMFNRFDAVQRRLKPISKHDDLEGTRAAYELSMKYRQLFGKLVKSMISQLNNLSDEKESQILNSVESLTNLKNNFLQKQGEVLELQQRVNTLEEELTSSKRLVQQQNTCILQMVKKENRVARLLYAIRRKGIDIDRIYIEEVQTPIDDSGLTDQLSEQEEGESGGSNRDEQERHRPPPNYQQRYLNQSY